MLTSLLLAVSLQFSSPVNYPVSLAGNFGEPRPHHFHGGIDVKTQQAVGKPIFSIGEGYVSRITIGISGFGNAVYVQHPNGYTSVYCHLKADSRTSSTNTRNLLHQQISSFLRRNTRCLKDS